jgi:acetyl-CoA C-acetyltransferase
LSFIIDAIRVPIGKVNGIYKNTLPETILAFLLKKIIERNNLNSQEISEIIISNAFGTGGNMARYASLEANLSIEIPAITIDSQCSGGLKSVEIAHNLLETQVPKLIIAGGLESKSLAPSKFFHPNDPRVKNQNLEFKVALFSPNQNSENALLEAAENVALKYHILKNDMMDWAVLSHQKANNFIDHPVFKGFIQKISDTHIDQAIKRNISKEKLQILGTKNLIDFTNSAHYHDAAAIVLMGNYQKTISTNLNYKAKIINSASVGFQPEFAPESILAAIEKVLINSGLNINQIDLFEINESFALTPLIFAKKFKISPEKTNILGGNLAYGHPFGASGTINLIHLIAGLKIHSKKLGLVAIPAAGGLATAMIIENVNR